MLGHSWSLVGRELHHLVTPALKIPTTIGARQHDHVTHWKLETAVRRELPMVKMWGWVKTLVPSEPQNSW